MTAKKSLYVFYGIVSIVSSLLTSAFIALNLETDRTPKNPLCWHQLCPRETTTSLTPKPLHIVIDHKVFVLNYNTRTKFADWVAYIVKAENTKYSGNTLKHKRIWKTDPKIKISTQASTRLALTPKSYKGAYAKYQYDRGHQAPLASFACHPLGEKTNYLSNITPQKACLNRGAWKKLEAAVRKMARHRPLYVVTGTLYDGKPQPPLPHATIPHQVPTGYWKLITYTGSDKKTACVSAFVFPQETPKNDTYCAHQVNLPHLKKRIHYQILPETSSIQSVRHHKTPVCPVVLC